MKRTYIIEITSTDDTRDAYLRISGLNLLRERFHNDQEAEAFTAELNNSAAFKAYNETAIVRDTY